MHPDQPEPKTPEATVPEPRATESRALVALETFVTVGLAFLASAVFGAFAFLGTAALVEEDGVTALIAVGKKMSLDLEAADLEQPPSIAETTELVAETLMGADVIVVPNGLHTRTLTAWLAEDLPNNALATVTGKLQNLGWERPEPFVVVQPGYVNVMENPRRMKSYVPQLISVQALIFIAAAWLLLRWRKPRPVSGDKGFQAAAIWGIGAAVAAFLFSSLMGGLMSVLGLKIEEQGWIQALLADKNALLGLAPWLVLVGPVSEEIFFRGYVFRRVSSAVGPGLGYALSAVLFALVHFHPVGLPMYIAIGLVFCWVYQRTGSLWAPIIGHVVYNGIVLSIPFLLPTPG